MLPIWSQFYMIKKPLSTNSMVAMTFEVVIQECTLKKSSRGAMSITEHPVLRQKRRSTIPLFINPVLFVFHKTGYGMLPSKCYVIRRQLLCFWKNKHPFVLLFSI
jgi:hypothetical protein